MGPATVRPSAKMLEKSAYWVALKRFCVRRSSRTMKAPVPMPEAPVSSAIAAYISGRLRPTCATSA